MVAPGLVDLFRGQDYTDEAIPYENRLLPLITALSRSRYAAVLMLKPAKTIAWASLFAGIRSKAGLGWRPYYPLTGFHSGYPHLANDDAHEIDYNLAVAYALFPGSAKDIVPRIEISDSLKDEARQRLSQQGLRRPVAILPANRGSSPNWTAGQYAMLAETLKLQGHEVAVIGGPGEEPILSLAATPSGAPVLGPECSILQLAALLSQCRLAVASSTGTLHLAAAVGIPTAGLFCAAPASRPQRWAPLGACHVQLVPRQERCAACDGSTRCDLSGITFNEMLAAVEKQL
jgi:ADP-heptose:LPS heptosyltransferase